MPSPLHIDFVVGMKRAIGDEAAIKFAVGFYDALGAGRTSEGFQIRMQRHCPSEGFPNRPRQS